MSRVSKAKIFLLGVGAQKAGTTWLHDYLSRHKSADLGFRKEYHVFDALSARGKGFFETRIRRGRAQLAELEERLETSEQLLVSPGNKNGGTFKLLDFLYDYDNYFDYFNGLYIKDSITLTGDITPAYSGLSSNVFQTIRDGFMARGVTVKVIFLMRDPVERFISNYQMQSGRPRRLKEGLEPPLFDVKLYNSSSNQDRGRYDITIQNLERVFSDTELHYEFYENLFDQKSIGKICQFLDIEALEAPLSDKVNESRQKLLVPDNVRRDIRQYLDPVYEFLYDRYSKLFIDSVWKNYN
jgi:hypothetical protein